MSKFEYRPLPKMVSLLLAFSASRWQAAALRPRFFALMQEQKVQKFGLVGGHSITRIFDNAAGSPSVWTISYKSASWAFMELLGTLAAVVLFEPGGDGVEGRCSARTGSKGNGHGVPGA